MKILFSFLIICIISTSVFTQTLDPEKISSIDSISNKYMKEYGIIGLSIGIVHNGNSNTFQYGYTNNNRNHAITDSSMYNIASVSKLFTATAIMQLAEKGQLNLEEKLYKIIPTFKMKDKRYTAITIRHLLTHTSGLMWDNTLKNSPDDTSSLNVFINNLHNKKLNFAPGEKLSYKTYSNVAFDLLGIVIEKKSGKKYDEYISEHILQPLQMTKSTFYFENVDTHLLAQPIVFSGNSNNIKRINLTGLELKDLELVANNKLKQKVYHEYGEYYEHNPSGNLLSSSYELNRWMQSMLDIYNNKKHNSILNNETLIEMWKTQKDIPTKKTSIGLGWWILQDDILGKSVFHVGNNPGFCTMLMIFPESNLGITILCNASYAQKAVWNKMTIDIAKLLLNK